MQINIKSRHFDLTNSLKEHIEEKIQKITKHFNQIIEVEVELIVEKNPSISENQTVEVTLFTRGPVMRAKESSQDMYASVDMVIDKIERQVEKYKGKIYHSNNKASSHLTGIKLHHSEEIKFDRPRIVKTKRFELKPMTPEEATLQLENLGHDFYVFTNSETDEVNVLYKRRDKNYGLIEPSYRSIITQNINNTSNS